MGSVSKIAFGNMKSNAVTRPRNDWAAGSPPKPRHSELGGKLSEEQRELMVRATLRLVLLGHPSLCLLSMDSSYRQPLSFSKTSRIGHEIRGCLTQREVTSDRSHKGKAKTEN